MNNLYIDMSSGVAGDMLVASLLDLSKDASQLKKKKNFLLDKLNLINLGEKIELKVENLKVNGINSLRVKFKTPEDEWFISSPRKSKNSSQHTAHPSSSHRALRHFSTIKKIILNSRLSSYVQDNVLKTFELLGRAEAKVHNLELAKVHFHEVGSLDAILEIVSFYLLLENLAIKKVFSSPLVLGSGYVNCQHGKMPVPVPAVLEMIKLKKAPFKKITENTGELTTPTGLALVLNMVDDFTFPEKNLIEDIGYGAGDKEIKNFTNVVRLLLLKPPVSDSSKSQFKLAYNFSRCLESDEILEISTNIDDMSSEELDVLLGNLLRLGALDVSYHSVIMKKGRMGFALTIFSPFSASFSLSEYLLKNSSTIGFRYQTLMRKKLKRKRKKIFIFLKNKKREVMIKESYWGNKLLKRKIETDSLKKILSESAMSGVSMLDIKQAVDKYYFS